MPVIALRSFTGEIPRLPAHLLPENAAQQSSYVDHSRGYLAPLKSGSALKTVGVGGWTGGGSTINSMYSREGVGWYTSSTTGVEYFQSPVIDEIYDRIYYLSGGRLKVSIWDIAQTMGGGPASSVNAGVPTPTVVPTLALVNLTTLPDYPSAAFTYKYWYESEGIRYQVSTMTPTTVEVLKTYRFSPAGPNEADDSVNLTPAGAKLVVEVTLKDGDKLLFMVNTSFGATVAARTQALPGGVEISLSQHSNTEFDINLSWGVVETRAYLYTMVNTFQEESAPSPAALISPTYIQNVQITTTKPTFTGYQPYSTTNVYRTFGGTPAYLKIDKTGSSDVWVDATHNASSVGTALTTAEWDVPPSVLSGLKLAPNGWFLAFNSNTLYMSEPYRPHTWPYSITFPTGVRGICVGAQGVVVTTFDETYIVTGAHPASVMQMRLPIPVGGVSHIGMCNIEGAVAYISHDGIVLVQGSNASLEFSEKLFTRRNWRDRYGTILSTIKLSYHDGFLIGSSPTADSSSGDYGFVIRVDEAQGQYTRFNKPISATARVPILDALYYTTTDDSLSARNVYGFNDGGSALQYTWWSKEFIFPQYVSFGAFYIYSFGASTITIYVDGAACHIFTANGTDYYRIPPFAGLRWSIKVVSSVDIHEIIMARTMGELHVG